MAAALVVAVALPMGAASASPRRDATIDLPARFAGEGVTVGRGNTFYAGSLADGRIARGNLRRRTADVWVSEPILAPAVGMKADLRHDLLWVAGGPTGQAAVYDLRTAEAAGPALVLTTSPSFINDVVATRNAAYFTNSRAGELYRVPVSRRGTLGDPEVLLLEGPAAALPGAFNLNGITATRDGKTLIVVNSTSGLLFTVDPKTGESEEIDLDRVTLPTADGILLSGRTLYVLQNGNAPNVPNQISVIRLDRDLSSGRVVDRRTSRLFETATTLAKRGDLLVAVNAQFDPADVIDDEAEVVLLRAHGHRRH